jgi:S1-C subfamily serine protease
LNWVDLLVVSLALMAAVSGARQGMVTAASSLLGVLTGAVIAMQLAPPLLAPLSDTARTAAGVGILLVFIVLGEGAGMWAGRMLRDGVVTFRLTWLDNVLGTVLQGAAVFVVAWMIALPFTSVNGMPGLASGITSSSVLRTVDSVMPASARALPEQLRDILGVTGLPEVLDPFTATPRAPASPPDPALESSGAVRQSRTTVFKINGQAASCGRSLSGSGFVISPQRVMTNAHVVAGTDSVSIEVGPRELDAEVVFFDPATDVAILAVPALRASPMPFVGAPAKSGEDVIAVGFPLGGPFTPSAGRVREEINLSGPDIYGDRTVERDVFTVRARVQSGNSGGPLINAQGAVVGVVFGASVDDPETGFVLTANEVADEVAAAPQLNAPVSTQECTQ